MIACFALAQPIKDKLSSLLQEEAIRDYRDDINRNNIIDWFQETVSTVLFMLGWLVYFLLVLNVIFLPVALWTELDPLTVSFSALILGNCLPDLFVCPISGFRFTILLQRCY